MRLQERKHRAEVSRSRLQCQCTSSAIAWETSESKMLESIQIRPANTFGHRLQRLPTRLFDCLDQFRVRALAEYIRSWPLVFDLWALRLDPRITVTKPNNKPGSKLEGLRPKS